MGHLQVVILTLGVAIQCAGLFYVSEVWVGERDLVIILVSAMSLLMYIYLLLWVCYNSCTYLSSILSSSGKFHADFDLLSFFLFSRCVGAGGLCGALWLQFYLLLVDLVTDCLLFPPLFGCWWSCLVGSRVVFLPFFFLFIHCHFTRLLSWLYK